MLHAPNPPVHSALVVPHEEVHKSHICTIRLLRIEYEVLAFTSVSEVQGNCPDGVSKNLRNVRKLLTDYTPLHPKEQQPIFLPTCKPEILPLLPFTMKSFV
jgi:hypothetical protein